MTTPSARPRDSFVRRHWGKLTLALLVLAPLVVFAAWSAVALTYTYSDGQRVGYNQKLSRKGWLCKTWEGELALSNVPGQAPELFQYSVRDDAVAQQIQQLEGARVALTYEQHKGLPTSCFGETEYFATGVARADDGTLPATVPQITPAAPAPPPAGASPAAVPGAPPAP
jgi:hypothetical protein